MVERPLRILQVSTADKQGGAEQVAWNLFAAYRARGHCSWLAVGVKRTGDPDVCTIPNRASHSRWFHFFHTIARREKKEKQGVLVETTAGRLAGILAEPARRFDYYRGVEDFHFPGTAHLLMLSGERPHVIHAHNLHGAYFDLRQLPWLSRQAPLLLTLHDAWLLSGHCAHSFGCKKWKTGCGRCPDLSIYPAIKRDATAYNWRRKRDIFSKTRLYLATPSQWLMQKVEESILAPAIAESRVIPNGVDLNIFRPAAQANARFRLAIPQDARVLLVAGINIRTNGWRDFETLKEAVVRVSQHLEGESLLLIALGEGALPEQWGRAEVRFVPFLESRTEMARYYQAADMYLHVSRADTFPTAVLEAMACGTPVVATAVGGITEQIAEGQTGFLTPPGDAITLAARIGQILSDPDLKLAMARRAVERVRRKYDLNRQVESYLGWYAAITAETEKAALGI
jgi:glycosyltransferase involved in cell wall biosynthesis